MIEGLPTIQKVLGLFPSTSKVKINKLFVIVLLFLKILKFELGIVTNVYNHSIKVGIRGLGIQGQLQLHSKFKDSLVYMSPCLKNPKINKYNPTILFFEVAFHCVTLPSRDLCFWLLSVGSQGM